MEQQQQQQQQTITIPWDMMMMKLAYLGGSKSLKQKRTVRLEEKESELNEQNAMKETKNDAIQCE